LFCDTIIYGDIRMNELKKIIKFLLAMLIVIIAVKFFIYALPFIIVLILGYLIYKKVKENNKQETVGKTKKINKKNNVLEGEVVKERVDD